jgi:hypothetical protein
VQASDRDPTYAGWTFRLIRKALHDSAANHSAVDRILMLRQATPAAQAANAIASKPALASPRRRPCAA